MAGGCQGHRSWRDVAVTVFISVFGWILLKVAQSDEASNCQSQTNHLELVYISNLDAEGCIMHLLPNRKKY